MRIFKGIQSKLLALVIVMTVLLIGTTLTISIYEFGTFVREALDKENDVVGRDIKEEIENLRAITLEQTNSLAGLDILRDAIKNNDREALFKIFDNYQSLRKCDFFTVIDAEGKVVVRTANREKFNDMLGQTESIKIAFEQKKAGVYFESTQGIPLSIRGSAPVLDTDGTLIGVLSTGFRIDDDKWVNHIKNKFGVEATTLVGKMRHVSTLVKDDGTSAAGTELNDPVILKRVFDDKEDFEGEADILGRRMKVYYSPIISSSGNVLGILFSGMPIDSQTQIINRNITTNLLVAGIGMVIFIVLLVIIVRSIVGPIRQMTVVANTLAGGGLDVNLDVRTGDELEVLSNAFKEVAVALKEKTDVALTIAKGDLRAWVPLKSENDILGKALIGMRYGFYDSIKDLRELASAVANEASNLAQLNERLVTNTVMSASQLKEVSSSVDRINTQTKGNAENAQQAEALSAKAHSDTAVGQQRMGRMVDSMNGITKSSEEIKKIIRVIDDIAFQTNLLALNAAVEAARAGTHGKGFAVVAEEVRSLAARSAKAAKETASLIEESIRQVELGSGVASETSESLNAVAEQVNKVNETIAKISLESGEQTKGLGAVNVAVSQLSSAADENSEAVNNAASAVTAVSETAQKLDGIITHFKMNEGGRVSPPAGMTTGHLPPSKTNFRKPI